MKPFIPLILLIFFVSGCKNDIVVPNDLAFRQKLVIHGIERDNELMMATISKTLPPWNAYDSASAEVTNASVFLVLDSGDTMWMDYFGNQGYYSYYPQKARMGISYKLFVNWNNLTATAVTKIPGYFHCESPIVNSEILNGGMDTNYFAQVTVYPTEGEVYGIGWRLSGFTTADTVLGELVRYNDRDPSGKIIVKSRPLPKAFTSYYKNPIAMMYALEVHLSAFDEQYYNYYMSQSANQATDNIFGRSSTNQKWNVTGDGIGIFIGRTDTLLRH